MGFSHFHGIWDKHICTISNGCCELIWKLDIGYCELLAIDFFHLFDIDFSFTNKS